MKTRTFVSILILVLAVLIIAGSCVTGKKAYKAKDKEELYGTWVNPDYDEVWIMAKWVLKPDGTFDAYSKSNSDRVFEMGTFSIVAKWSDSNGNIYYRYYKTNMDTRATKNLYKYYFLVKIHSTLDTAEELWSSVRLSNRV
jgi:ABC-type antimicrobial peptide transport system permease subunit